MADPFSPIAEVPKAARIQMWKKMVGESQPPAMYAWISQILSMGGSVTIQFGPGQARYPGPWWMGAGRPPGGNGGGSVPPPGGGGNPFGGGFLDVQTT